MILDIDTSLVDWSRGQFALTALYHWLFVPLTLGLGVIQAIMETIYFKTGSEFWKKTTQFWMKIFGINFAIGLATGIILEFEFGTNWSNYSWFVGDIFGAPLAIEAILAFFMESTFVAIMFFGWNKVSKRFHLASTWLTIIGATLSALWILIANAWMQYPVGMDFNPDTVRNEMTNFGAVALSPVAIYKFLHTVFSGWVTASVVVIGISAWYLLKKREVQFSVASMKVASVFGLASACLILWTGDGTAHQVAQKQPMKLAAMEGLYEGGNGVGLVAVGILNSEKKDYNDNINPMIVDIKIPKLLSVFADRTLDGYVPGIKNIIDGGYPLKDGTIALSATEKMAKGRLAIQALSDYRQAKENNDTQIAAEAKSVLMENYPHFGYGYFKDPTQLIPNVAMVFYSFRIMVYLGCYFFLLFLMTMIWSFKNKMPQARWLQYFCVWTIPFVYICEEVGWIVAEMGRQPWAIQNILPTHISVSNLSTGSVQTTFFLFLTIFTLLLIADIGIILSAVRKGPGIVVNQNK